MDLLSERAVNEGASKKSIVDFVTRVTTQGSPDFVPPAERIATFDNDGTLGPSSRCTSSSSSSWIAEDPRRSIPWKTTEPFASLLKALKALAGASRPRQACASTSVHEPPRPSLSARERLEHRWLEAASQSGSARGLTFCVSPTSAGNGLPDRRF